MSRKLPVRIDTGMNLLQRAGSLVSSVLPFGEVLTVAIGEYAENCRHEREIGLQRDRLHAEARHAGAQLQAGHCESMTRLEMRSRQEERQDHLRYEALCAHERDCVSMRTALGAIAADAAQPVAIRLDAIRATLDYQAQAHAQRLAYLAKPPDAAGD